MGRVLNVSDLNLMYSCNLLIY